MFLFLSKYFSSPTIVRVAEPFRASDIIEAVAIRNQRRQFLEDRNRFQEKMERLLSSLRQHFLEIKARRAVRASFTSQVIPFLAAASMQMKETRARRIMRERVLPELVAHQHHQHHRADPRKDILIDPFVMLAIGVVSFWIVVYVALSYATCYLHRMVAKTDEFLVHLERAYTATHPTLSRRKRRHQKRMEAKMMRKYKIYRFL